MNSVSFASISLNILIFNRMKKVKHPKYFKTKVIYNDGAHLNIEWVFPKKKLKLENDYLHHRLWLGKKKVLKKAG